MVFKELNVGDMFKIATSPDTYKKIEVRKRNPSGCGCDKVNAENVTSGSVLKISDFTTVEKING